MDVYCMCVQQYETNEWTYKKAMEIKFISRLKFAERLNVCICIDVRKIYEGDDFNEVFEVLSRLKTLV